ncbi:MAG: MerR family transcriptional regulator [Mesorhizobium sp.]
MSNATFTVAEAAKLVGIDVGRLRGWLQHRHITFGTRSLTGRYSFTIRDVRAIALMARLVDHGHEPGLAADRAIRIVDRAAGWRHAPLAAVFSLSPNVSPCLIPEDAAPETDALVVIPLAPLFAEIDAKAAA